MKVLRTSFPNELERLVNSLKKIPIVEQCDWFSDKENGFAAIVKFADHSKVIIEAIVLKRAYPAKIAEAVIASGFNVTEQSESWESLGKRANADEFKYPVLMAPYISSESAKQCENLKVGFMDTSGNFRLHVHCLYISEQGHPNQHVQIRKPKNIFDSKSRVSSIILREIMRDVSRQWKLSLLSEILQCSIGQVFKVKNYLCEQLWAEMTREGLRILEAEAIMRAWGEAYSSKETGKDVLDCYTLDALPVFEEKVQDIRIKQGIHSCLTGIAGGVRYVPVVRYNKIHLIIQKKDVNDFMNAAGCKVVDSGSNVQIRSVSSDELLYDARELNGYLVASPVQIYLDCMELKGRGEEVANAIFAREVKK